MATCSLTKRIVARNSSTEMYSWGWAYELIVGVDVDVGMECGDAEMPSCEMRRDADRCAEMSCEM
jgi:hypothetical protein